MENTQNILSGKTWPGLFRAIRERTSGGSLKRSQKAIFQCLQVESGRQPEWLELGDQGGELRTTAWRRLDAQFWGVPQRRKRVYLVCDFRGGDAGQILFECESLLGYPGTGTEAPEGSAADLENSAAGTDSGGLAEEPDGQLTLDFGRTADRIYINTKKSVTLMGRAGGGGGKTGLYLLPVYTIAGNVIGRTGIGGGNQLGINQDTAPTLTTNDRHAVVYAAGMLHKAGPKAGGLGYTEEKTPTLMSDNARYMALGNSIAVPCAERVFVGIIRGLGVGGDNGGESAKGLHSLPVFLP